VENYFNYFTEIEECFRHCRGTPSLLSTLDWALVESWKEAGLPLEAVLAGIERSFEKFAKRPPRFRKVNSLAYCSQEVLRAAGEARASATEGGGPPGGERPAAPPFEPGEIPAFLERNARAVETAARSAQESNQKVLGEDLDAAASDLRQMAASEPTAPEGDLQETENRLSTLEEKLTAALTRASSVELLAEFRREGERGLASYRRKMSAAQIESLERQFLKSRLFEHYKVPRLSLFYL
jgi:hypothetical protein